MSSLADHIERYIKQRLRASENQALEISRAELADFFRCVPSQINYVLATRFTLDRGYIIESRRGGGGYIHIVWLRNDQKNKVISNLLQQIGPEIDHKKAEDLLTVFQDLGVISARTMRLAKGIIQQETANFAKGRDALRASLLRALMIFCLRDEE